jgi:hypothetical protein
MIITENNIKYTVVVGSSSIVHVVVVLVHVVVVV